MVEAIEVRDNQHVTAGQVLFRLDPLPFQLKLDQAQSQLGIVRDNLNALKANYQNVQAQIKQAEAQIAFNQLQYQRQETLARQQFTPQMALDQARLNLLDFAANAGFGQGAVAPSIVANLDGNPDIPIEQHPQYRQALAQRDEAARELRDTVVRAPYNGTVTNVPSLEPGMYLPASTPAFYLVGTERIWVEPRPRKQNSPMCAWVSPPPSRSTPIRARAGAAPWRASARPRAGVSLLPAQNTSGNWVKVVQRIPLRVQIDTTDKSCRRCARDERRGPVDTGTSARLPHFLTALFGGEARG